MNVGITFLNEKSHKLANFNSWKYHCATLCIN